LAAQTCPISSAQAIPGIADMTAPSNRIVTAADDSGDGNEAEGVVTSKPDELPCAVAESSFQIGSLTMRVYHLDDGRRILNADDVATLFGGALADSTEEEMLNLASVVRGKS